MAVAETVPPTSLPSGVGSSSATTAGATAPAADAKPANAAPAAATTAAPAATPAAEAKPAAATAPKSLLGDEPAATTTDAPPAPVADAAPAEIVYSLKAPEKSALTADDLTAIEVFAKERKLAPEAAQAIVERESKLLADAKARDATAVQANVDGLAKTWREQVQKDPTIGGEHWKQTVALVDRALVDAPDLHALLKDSPLRFHPAVVSYLAKQGARTVEDAPPAAASAPAAEAKSASARWFPNLAAKKA